MRLRMRCKRGPVRPLAAMTSSDVADGLHLGGGITDANALDWIRAGAQKVRRRRVSPLTVQVIITSFLFPSARFDLERLKRLSSLVGKDRLVVDVSCRKRGDRWIVAMNRWQDLTDLEVNAESLAMLAEHCSELLIHAADVEGLCQGIDEQLVESALVELRACLLSHCLAGRSAAFTAR